MQVNGLDHVNIVTDDVPGTALFYAELLDLEVRDGPAPTSPDKVRWVHVPGGPAIVHINAVDVFQPMPRDARPGPATGAVHHVAFNCTGHAETLARLRARGLDHKLNAVPSIGLTQIFVVDPNGVLLELNFFGD